MKKLIPDTKSDTIKSVYDSDETTLLYGKEAANRINSYFCNISTVLDTNLPPSAGTIQDTYNDKLAENNMITLEELMKEIKNIDIAKGSGLLGISAKLLKTIFCCTPICLLHVMNRCLIESKFPKTGN